jgi:hypothetical protein
MQFVFREERQEGSDGKGNARKETVDKMMEEFDKGWRNK